MTVVDCQSHRDLWTPRTRFQAALRGEMPDQVPFVIWNNKLPGGQIDEALLEAGACVVVKSRLYDVVLDGVEQTTESWIGPDGFSRVRTTYLTRAGNLSQVDVLRPGTTWRELPPFTGPGDYDALIALVEARRCVPCTEQFLSDDALYGDSGIARPNTEATPMHEIIYKMLGVEAFATEWYDRRAHILALYNALVAKRREALAIVAASPAYHATIEANIAVDIVGMERFKRYYIPLIEEACDILHAKGILAGAHLDGKNRVLARFIAGASLDYIESFTPPPDCDLSIAEARSVWPGKALYVNYPSSYHLQGPEAVCDKARDLLAEGAPGAGLVLGILEDIPRVDTMVPLARTVRNYGITPLPEQPQPRWAGERLS